MDGKNNELKPAFFGIERSNRDFSKKANWGKNIFNNAFPVALLCYMQSRNIEPVYLRLDSNANLKHDTISVKDVFGIASSEKVHFCFEDCFIPYAQLVAGELPRVDLVTYAAPLPDAKSCRALEIKLTALPDHTTCHLAEEQYGSEIVVRPDTIVYLALSIAATFANQRRTLSTLLKKVGLHKLDWSDAEAALRALPAIKSALDKVMLKTLDQQIPMLLQPVWKTEGKS